MAPPKTKINTLCVVSFLIVLLGLGLFCIFKPPAPQETIPTLKESQIRTPLEDSAMAANNNTIKAVSPNFPDDNIELIET